MSGAASSLPVPGGSPDAAPYWAAARQGQLLLRRCRDCGHWHFLPRVLCPQCWSQSLDWLPASGAGHIHSFSIVRRAPLPAFAPLTPYVVALIDLAEGPRMLANIVGSDALESALGDAVQVCFEARDAAGEPEPGGAHSGRAQATATVLPQFRRVTTQPAVALNRGAGA